MRHSTPKSSSERAPSSAKRENHEAYFGQNVACGVEMEKRDSLKLDEQRGNVYENKGSAFHSPRRSGNVYEKTGT